MAKKEILQFGQNILRKKSLKVSLSEIPSASIQKILEEMKEALAKEKDGVAIAAPQIGYSKRIFVVSPKVFKINKEESSDLEKHLVYINPEIVKLSRKKHLIDEGCLSVRWKYGKVRRSDKVVVEAYDNFGKKFQRGASGLLAQIFQHEVDHLDGILFVDKAIEIKEYTPEHLKNNK